MFTTLRRCAVIALCTLPATAAAIDYRAVANTAILYASPAEDSEKLYILATGTPVEIVVEREQWVRVREPGGALNWLQRTALAEHRTVMVTSESALVRERPNTDARPILEAARNVVFELIGAPENGWIEVRHQDGLSGYLRVTEVWGL